MDSAIGLRHTFAVQTKSTFVSDPIAPLSGWFGSAVDRPLGGSLAAVRALRRPSSKSFFTGAFYSSVRRTEQASR